MTKTAIQANKPDQEQIAIDRLRRSKEELETELRSSGMEAGRNFVLKDEDADAACQRNLERANKDGTQFNCFTDLAKVLCGDNGMEDDWRENFQVKYGNEIEEPEWADGFIEGALEKFEELEEKL